jgi:hypothetical protein
MILAIIAQPLLFTGLCPLRETCNQLNHIGAIKYFICDYNLTKCAALPGSHYLEGSIKVSSAMDEEVTGVHYQIRLGILG